MMRVVPILLAVLALMAAPAAAQPGDCGALPRSAQKARTCNPQQDCLAKVDRLKGAARDAARKDCQRLPSSGTCYGPDTFNPQADCRERQTKKR
jgi:hypothetical protein